MAQAPPSNKEEAGTVQFATLSALGIPGKVLIYIMSLTQCSPDSLRVYGIGIPMAFFLRHFGTTKAPYAA